MNVKRLYCKMVGHDWTPVPGLMKILVCETCDKVLDYGDYHRPRRIDE